MWRGVCNRLPQRQLEHRQNEVAGMIRAAHIVAAVLGSAALSTGVAAQSAQVQRVVTAEGDTLVVTSTGSGPAVVIVPGLLGGAYSFRQVTPALVRAGLRVVVVEPLGMGESSRPKAADYSLETQATRIGYALNAAGVGDAIFLCHAVGGAICYRYALQSPSRVLGIVAVNSGPDEHAASSGVRRAVRYAPIIRLVGGAGRARAKLREGLVDNSADPSWVTAEVLEVYGRPYQDFGAVLTVLSAMAAAREPEPLAPRLGRIRAPVRLLVGTAGNGGLTRANQIEVLRAIPDFHVTRVADAGQYIQEERPRAVVDAVLSLHRRVVAAVAEP
jgi:pimeloyl-ACP methyl ester carboxylesterase